MNWFSANRGYIVCAVLGILVGALGVLWLKKPSKSQPVSLISRPAPVQPQFEKPPLGRLGGSSGATEGSAIDTLAKPAIAETPKTEEESRNPQEPLEKPCPAFTLHLSSSDSVPKQFGLDSVSVSYRYPVGDYYFAFWGRSQTKDGTPKSTTPGQNFLSVGLSTAYLRYQNNVSATGYVRVHLSGLNLYFGYHHQTRQQLSWFVSVGKEWRVF